MPRLRTSARAQAFAKFEGLIAEGLRQQGLKKGDLSKRVGCSETRMRNIRKNPLKATFEEIGKISDVTGIPEERFHEVLCNVPRK